ncbi:MAG: hypothetical protein GX221_00615 [Candidatus Riflebacteria bacterium]|nr:hypothetical protein [Candidatus Riflebacteria bacterium]
MDRNTLVGSILGIVLIGTSIKMGGNLGVFIDLPSILIVFGGAMTAMMVSYDMQTIKAAMIAVWRIFKAPEKFDSVKLVSDMLNISEIARKEGILALDAKISEIENPFLARCLQMVVDSVDMKIIEEVAETEIEERSNRHASVKSALDFYASVLPAFGMIGTIIGLVGLLSNLDDPSTIGPNMAVALVTTFFGTVSANLFFIPAGNKLTERSQAEQLYSEIVAKGCLFIAAGVHPRILQERLLAYLPASQRADFAEKHLTENFS